ncbi:hypothetical protein CORC01_04601 [Colletotrichum orchidophilum]|uniref:Polymerase/histidinol phosphatase N-terminal domain-containing protein n=1 Tax=Colletotrichum orchidophilum TaxID=1209926 RepID=A0A1G4BFW1_9PEZI|nr:uncharacterized protein CORC01_04601 [Colletotrichum orchidophilum]OHF00193.1 hypothetical protein CORC01_04601 [Colletotrichum orchidophilum]
MKTLSDSELQSLAGDYFAPTGLYQHLKKLPFLGRLDCNISSLTAGEWTELIVEYVVGSSGLADGAWIKGTFKFYSDWALFQTSDPKRDNYVSAEHTPGPLHPGQTPATVQSLYVRFDQKGHERPFQKAIIIDIVDGYMNPGDKITVRIGDRRWGSRGTRAQTFVEDSFLMRWYIDPVGTSRFAPIKPDVTFPIKPGPISRVKIVTPRLVSRGSSFPVHIHTEDKWGNVTADVNGLSVRLTTKACGFPVGPQERHFDFPNTGWTTVSETISLESDGDYEISAEVRDHAGLVIVEATEFITVDTSLAISRPYFADLHVHSDDTVGTNSTTYNFSYAREIAGLDIVGYTANDFNITKERWQKTLAIIKQINCPGEFVVFPGTEWCGNSAVGGDHNVVFLDDPSTTDPEFPVDKRGNVVRSFEWNEDGPSELVPGAWPLDEVYATYAQSADQHLMIPHVGGRRCNLAWHHPRLERLVEIGSAWGLFEWLLRDAVARGWEVGVSANSDEHRGRCGGGVPGTAVFGTKGGLTGVVAPNLHRREVAIALRARRTFATTGERLVGLASTSQGHLQGDDVDIKSGQPIEVRYRFFGSNGFSTIEAWDNNGRLFCRDIQEESSRRAPESTRRKLRVKWGGARVFDRYREATWHGSVIVSGTPISHVKPFGGVLDNPEDTIKLTSQTQILFDTRTSGDFDGVDIFLEDDQYPHSIRISGQLGGYVKVGDILTGNPHSPQPKFDIVVKGDELRSQGGKSVEIQGGVELFVAVESLLDVPLPRRVEGEITISPELQGEIRSYAVYFVGREHTGAKVITSPMFFKPY